MSRPVRFPSVVLLAIVLLFTLNAHGIPAFARKYGLRRSACHTNWPVLNDFGWRFKDNGYQLMNSHDAPIWQSPAYWPVTFRMTPNWHRENTNKVQVDTAAGPGAGETGITQHGFDLSGLDILTAGTLEQNISFLLVPSADETGAFHFESVWVRLDNLFKTPWLNLKFGKFELDNFISEKRTFGLSSNGGFYQLYHFVPPGDNNAFGQIGDNQLGLEWSGHSFNDHTRASAALFSSNNGNVDLQNANNYSGYFTLTQASDLGGVGLQRVGAYLLVGEAPTYSLPNSISGPAVPIAGSSLGSKSFHREGVFGDFYFSRFDVATYYQHGVDNKYFGTGTAGNAALPIGAQSPSWNGGFIEPHFTLNPQMVFFQRSEWVRMSKQPLASNPGNLGNIDAYTFGARWYPIMTMHGWFVVVKGPYGMSNDQGSYTIKGLPPGNYTVTAWHETLGTKTQKITVATGKPTSADFTFTAK